MGHFNKVILMGALVRDPKLRYVSETGTAMCFFQIAVNRALPQSIAKRMRQDHAQLTPEEQDKMSDYPWCYAVGNTAEQCAQSLRAGSTVFIEGKYETRNYTDKGVDGDIRYCPYCSAAINGTAKQVRKSKTTFACPECRGEIVVERRRSASEIRVEEIDFIKNFKMKDEKLSGLKQAEKA